MKDIRIEGSTKGTTIFNTISIKEAIEKIDDYIPSGVSNPTGFKNGLKMVLRQINENTSVEFDDTIQFYVEVGMLLERYDNLITSKNFIKIMRNITLHKGDIVYFTDFFMVLICKQENKIIIL